MLISILFAMSTAFAGDANDLLCANEQARQYAAGRLAVREEDLFSKSILVNGELKSGFLIYETVGDLIDDALESPGFLKIHKNPEFSRWRFYWGLPRGTQAKTPITKVFCRY